VNRNYDCPVCRDGGVIAPRWQDDTDRPVLCPEPSCAAAYERRMASAARTLAECEACDLSPAERAS